jgi:hypothetical protein
MVGRGGRGAIQLAGTLDRSEPPGGPPGDIAAAATRKFISVLPARPTADQATTLTLPPCQGVFWPSALVGMLLRDDSRAIRLTALMHLLEHPRGGIEATLKSTEAKDPFPWCRLLAHGIRVFKPDLPAPDVGIRFAL